MLRRQFLQLSAFSLAAVHFSSFAHTTFTQLNLPAHLKNNPLFALNDLPQFSAIKPEHINPALDFLLAHNRQVIQRISAQKNITWENFYQPLADAGDQLGQVWGLVTHLMAVKNSDVLRKAHEQANPKLSAFRTWYGLHKGLYRGFQALKNGSAFSRYSEAQKQAIEDALLDFRLSGIALPAAKQKRYAQITARLSQLSTQFSNNVLDSSMSWEKLIDDEKALSGLNDLAKNAARESAKSKGKQGYRFTLDYPSYSAVVTYSDNPKLRREMYTAYATRATQGKWNNTPVIEEILRLRWQLAQLLGFKTYSDYALTTRMAKTPKQVFDFLYDLLKRSRPQAQQELAQLQDYASEKFGVKTLNAWDLSYYAEKLKAERYSVDQETLRPYFPEKKVLSGLFEVAKRVFGLQFRERKNVDVWDENVRFFDVFNEKNQKIASFYLDMYAREHKRGGAWMDSARERRKLANGDIQLPIAYLVLNCSKPTEGKPALLTHNEVTTLFHEFGHGLHHMMTVVDVAAVSGINGVPWDAVEFPSQMLEGWTWDKNALTLISEHYQTGEPLPTELLDKVLAAKNFQAARALVRQLEFGLLDFTLHTHYRLDKKDFLNQTNDFIKNQVAVFPEPKWVKRGHSFSHIFAGGYAAGYYGYLWSEVLAADAFARFERDGLFNRQTGQAFVDKLLSRGGSREPMNMFTDFMGRAPQLDALLQQRGIQNR